MSISTRKGDDGTTSLLFGKRVPKTHPRVAAYGTVDELNSAIGLCRAHGTVQANAELLRAIQRALMAVMSELATDDADQDRFRKKEGASLTTDHLDKLDKAVAAKEAEGGAFRGWEYPGDNAAQAFFDQARSTCRRAERAVLALGETGAAVRPLLPQYLNRLSDLLWLLAREAARATDGE